MSGDKILMNPFIFNTRGFYLIIIIFVKKICLKILREIKLFQYYDMEKKIEGLEEKENTLISNAMHYYILKNIYQRKRNYSCHFTIVF